MPSKTALERRIEADIRAKDEKEKQEQAEFLAKLDKAKADENAKTYAEFLSTNKQVSGNRIRNTLSASDTSSSSSSSNDKLSTGVKKLSDKIPENDDHILSTLAEFEMKPMKGKVKSKAKATPKRTPAKSGSKKTPVPKSGSKKTPVIKKNEKPTPKSKSKKDPTQKNLMQELESIPEEDIGFLASSSSATSSKNRRVGFEDPGKLEERKHILIEGKGRNYSNAKEAKKKKQANITSPSYSTVAYRNSQESNTRKVESTRKEGSVPLSSDSLSMYPETMRDGMKSLKRHRSERETVTEDHSVTVDKELTDASDKERVGTKVVFLRKEVNFFFDSDCYILLKLFKAIDFAITIFGQRDRRTAVFDLKKDVEGAAGYLLTSKRLKQILFVGKQLLSSKWIPMSNFNPNSDENVYNQGNLQFMSYLNKKSKNEMGDDVEVDEMDCSALRIWQINTETEEENDTTETNTEHAEKEAEKKNGKRSSEASFQEQKKDGDAEMKPELAEMEEENKRKPVKKADFDVADLEKRAVLFSEALCVYYKTGVKKANIPLLELESSPEEKLRKNRLKDQAQKAEEKKKDISDIRGVMRVISAYGKSLSIMEKVRHKEKIKDEVDKLKAENERLEQQIDGYSNMLKTIPTVELCFSFRKFPKFLPYGELLKDLSRNNKSTLGMDETDRTLYSLARECPDWVQVKENGMSIGLTAADEKKAARKAADLQGKILSGTIRSSEDLPVSDRANFFLFLNGKFDILRWKSTLKSKYDNDKEEIRRNIEKIKGLYVVD